MLLQCTIHWSSVPYTMYVSTIKLFKLTSADASEVFQLLSTFQHQHFYLFWTKLWFLRKNGHPSTDVLFRNALLFPHIAIPYCSQWLSWSVDAVDGGLIFRRYRSSRGVRAPGRLPPVNLTSLPQLRSYLAPLNWASRTTPPSPGLIIASPLLNCAEADRSDWPSARRGRREEQEDHIKARIDGSSANNWIYFHGRTVAW